MSDSDGIEAARAFIDAFNAEDHERLPRTLNDPQVRLANRRLVIRFRSGYLVTSR